MLVNTPSFAGWLTRSIHQCLFAVASTVALGLILSAAALPGAAQERPTGAQRLGARTVSEASSRSNEGPPGHALSQALALARHSADTMQAVRDYTCLFTKKEMVNGRLLVQVMDMNLRQAPFSVMFRFQGPQSGRLVSYVQGTNGNQLQVREAGIASLVVVSLAVNSPQVMAENRYPITRVGMQNMVDTVVAQWEADQKIGGEVVKFFPNAKVGDVPCQAIEVTHPTAQPGLKIHTTRLYIDKATDLPVRVEQFAFPRAEGEPPPLLEEYTYSKIRTNVGLSDQDFRI